MRIASVLICGVLAGCNPNPYPGEQGSVMHVGIRLLPKSFDPPQIAEEGSGKIAAHVYDSLLAYHPFARPYQLEPGLAAEMPTVSEDGRTYRFKLRQDVYFHDNECFPGGKGRKMTAHDVAFAFKRFAHPETHAQGWWLFDGWIAGLNEWRDARKEQIKKARDSGESVGPLYGIEADVEGFKVIDEFTFELTTTKNYPQLLWVLAMPYTSIYPREAIEFYGDEYRKNPVGTGPFQLKNYNPVYRVELEKNPTFREVRVPDPASDPSQRWPGWEEEVKNGNLTHAGERIPLLDGMEIRFILEDQPRWLYFKSGYLDFLNPPKDNVKEAMPNGGEISEEMKAQGVTVVEWTELGTVYACLNTEDETLKNVELRRAMALAYDHAWTIDNLYAGQAIVAKSLIPPGVAGFTNYHPYHQDDGHADLKRAKEFMVKAGYPEGIDPKTGKALHITFENSGSSVTNRLFADRLKDEMRRIGIDVGVTVNTFPQMIEKMRNKQFQMAGLAWGFDYPDAQNILQLLYGPNKAPGINSSNFDNPEFNRLYRKAAVMGDSPERTKVYEQMAHIVSDEVPWITRAHRIRPNLQHSWLKGYKYTGVNYQYWRYSSIDHEARTELVTSWNHPIRWPLAVMALLLLAMVGVGVAVRKKA